MSEQLLTVGFREEETYRRCGEGLPRFRPTEESRERTKEETLPVRRAAERETDRLVEYGQHPLHGRRRTEEVLADLHREEIDEDERRSVGRAGGQQHSSLQAFLLGDRGEGILSEEDRREDQTCRRREEGNAQDLAQPTDERKNVETQSTSVDNGGESPGKKTNEASGDAIDEQNSSPTEEIGDEEEKLIASRPRLLSIEPLSLFERRNFHFD